MKHEYSLSHLTALSLDPIQLIDVAASAGYEYVGLRLNRVTPEEPLYRLIEDRALMKATKARLAETGVRVLDVELARMSPELDAKYFLPLLEAGAELGAKHVITQLPDPDRARATERFATICDLAAPLGLTIDLEFPTWTETPNVTEDAKVLRAVNKPNAGMLIDTLHVARSESSLDDLRQMPREWFHYAQVCDAPAEAPATKEGLIHAARCERLFPGEGGIDVRGILACIPLNIPYALEIPRDSLARVIGVEECARLALVAAKNYLDGVEAAREVVRS
jgi:sugar phosphate isomerase/epimerase